MPVFSDLVDAQLSGAVVRCAPLVVFGFRSKTMRLWPGFGPLEIGGERYDGVANLGQLSTATTSVSQAVEEMEFTLFGDAGLLAAIRDDAEESDGREVEVKMQFFDVRRFDDAGNWVDWTPLDQPITIFWGIMGPPKVTRPVANPGERPSRIVTVTAGNAFTNRRKPAYGFYSDRDQRARTDGGDNIFLTMSRVTRVVHWPVPD